ncbi:sugar phosphate isomerase/epimerase family protein [Rhizobium sp. LEGMi198b]
MLAKKNRLILHNSVAWSAPLTVDIEIAAKVGFDGIDPSTRKLRNFLNAGFTEDELKARVSGVDIPGFGAVFDVERQGPSEADLMKEAEAIFHLANVVGARGVQVLTGPVDVRAVVAHSQGIDSGLYTGVLGLPRAEQIAITTRNLVRLADLAAEFGVLLYMEPLSWTPLNKISDHVEIIERAGRDNLKLIVDYWHCFTAGDTPDAVARLDKNIMYGVHICDSLPFDGGTPDENVLRNVSVGGGVIDLQQWTDAVKATGYDDWWGCESLSLKLQQENGYDVARDVYNVMTKLIRG